MMSTETVRRSVAPKVDHPSYESRVERGKRERKRLPRADHAVWDPPADRPDPIAILEGQSGSRVQDLLPIRHGRMMASAFAFYRGAAAIMASDLASMPHTGIMAQLAGDAHLSNFGGFAAPDRTLIFDLNDFDETLPGPWEWDLKRLTASFAIGSRARGFSKKERAALIRRTAQAYRLAIREFAPRGNLDVWYVRFDLQKKLEELRATFKAKETTRLEAALAKGERKNSMRAFNKLTTMVDGEPHIVSDPPLVVPITELYSDRDAGEIRDQLAGVLRSYRRSLPNDRRHLLEGYRLVDVARKVVGVGSVGTRAWIALMLGVNDTDPLFLQFKEAQESVLAPYIGKSKFANQGQRVVEGQRLMQAASDVFLGFDRIDGADGIKRDYYVRQLWDGKLSPDVERMPYATMGVFADACGWTLARAHARSGDRVAIAAYLGSSDVFDRALVDFAEVYADQNDRDYAAMVEAVSSGRLVAEQGV